MDLISLSLLANIPKHSKKCHEWFRLGMGLGADRVERRSFRREWGT